MYNGDRLDHHIWIKSTILDNSESGNGMKTLGSCLVT